MQDVHDPRAFTIVERFETEAVSDPDGDQLMQNEMERSRELTSEAEPKIPP